MFLDIDSTNAREKYFMFWVLQTSSHLTLAIKVLREAPLLTVCECVVTAIIYSMSEAKLQEPNNIRILHILSPIF